MTLTRRLTRSMLALAVALAAGGVLLARAPNGDPAAPPGRVAAAVAWPNADRATLIGELPDGTAFEPGHFLDARTAVGTAPSSDGRSLRLVVRGGDGQVRELRRLPRGRGFAYGSFAATDTRLVWAEATGGSAPEIWAADLRDARSPAGLLTADTGEAALSGSQYDLVINDSRVYWTAVPDDGRITEIRSVALTGGPVSVRTEEGRWILSAWPWLTDGSDRTSTARLRDPRSGRDVDVDVDSGTGTELLTCSPAWCRVTVMGSGGISRVDLMRHDGSQRTTVAGGDAGVVSADVAILDRFELVLETRPGAGKGSTTALQVHDLTSARTVEISPAARSADSRAGVLWWSTGGDPVVWHTLDLRTV